MKKKEHEKHNQDLRIAEAQRRVSGPPLEATHKVSSTSDRQCRYCCEPVSPAAVVCPHCRRFIDPRFTEEVLDEGVYRQARARVLLEIKEDIIAWAQSRLVFATTLIGAFLSLGAFAFISVTTKSIVNDQVSVSLQKELNEEIPGFEQKFESVVSLVPTLQGSTVSNRAQLGTLQTNVFEYINWSNEYQQAADERMNRIEHTLDIRKSDTDERTLTLIHGVASRYSADTPPVLLTSPASLLGEPATVRYRLMQDQVRFSWLWAGEGNHDVEAHLSYHVQIASTPAMPPDASFVTNTPFTSVAIPAAMIFESTKARMSSHVQHFYWRVEAHAADGGRQVASSRVGTFEIYKDGVERIRETRVLRIGIADNEKPPFVEADRDSDGRLRGRGLRGFEIDLAEKLASNLPPVLGIDGSLRLQFLRYDWLRLLNAPRRNEVDIIVSTITISTPRAETYSLMFSLPYLSTHQAAVFLANDELRERFQRLSAINTLSNDVVLVGVDRMTGLAAGRDLSVSPNDVRIAATVSEAVEEVLSKKAQAAIIDYPIARDQQERQRTLRGAHLEVVKLDRVAGIDPELYGLGVREGETHLLDAINRVFADLEEGELGRWRTSYGLE